MKMEVVFSNLQDKVEVTDALAAVVECAVQGVAEYCRCSPEEEVSIVFVDDHYIQGLNRDYRQLDKPTDVLSFPMLEEGGEEPVVVDGPPQQMLGDIVISLERAQNQAVEYGHSLERELAFLTVHGMLHLLGYDHENEEERQAMREAEETILTFCRFTR